MTPLCILILCPHFVVGNSARLSSCTFGSDSLANIWPNSDVSPSHVILPFSCVLCANKTGKWWTAVFRLVTCLLPNFVCEWTLGAWRELTDHSLTHHISSICHSLTHHISSICFYLSVLGCLIVRVVWFFAFCVCFGGEGLFSLLSSS